MAKQKGFTTPKGTALYPYLRSPEVFEGKELGFTIKVIFEPEDQEKFEAFLKSELEKAKQLPEFTGKKWKTPMLAMGETKDGKTFFKFKAAHKFTIKSGEVIDREINIFDADLNKLPKEVDPKNGSIVKVSFTILPYNTGLVCGLSLRISAVQVIELVEYNGATAEQYGFTAEHDPLEDEIPF